MKKISEQIISFGLIVFIVLIYLVFFLQIVNHQRIAWGVKVADFNLSQTNLQTVPKTLKDKLDGFAEQELNFFYQDKSWSVKLIDLGFLFDERATLEAAYQIGHQANILINFKEQLIAFLIGRQIAPAYQLDQEHFQDKTSELFRDIERPAQNASLVFNQEIDGFSLEHSTEGTTIKRGQLLTDLAARIRSFSSQPIELQLVLDYPTVENDEVESARQKAEQILAGQPYQLTFEGKYWTIDKERIIDWLKFEPVKEEDSNNQILGCFLDEEKIKDYLAEIAKTIDQPTANARLETEGNRAVVFSAGQAGFQVYQEETIQELTKNILAQSSISQTEIIASIAPPKITLSQTNNLGINTLIGQGISNFGGSPKNRIHNIKTGTVKLNGLILNPGEEFSFNTLLGGSGPEQGFLPELVIKKNKTVPEYGGGLCQVSTTLFRVAVNSGLEITERSPHAFPVVYYSPQGFDATVYEPHPDLRFINNTPAHLLIEGVVWGSQLIFNFYGSDDGRQVQIKGPYLLEKNEDGSMKTILHQEVYQKDELVHQQTFYSNYDSPNLYPIEGGEEGSEEN
jgi:vancomycin resistance protein YoaR